MIVKNIPPNTHYPRGGSVSDRIMQCPGSVHIAKKYGSNGSSPAAIDGTHTHTLVETCAKLGFMSADIFVGRKLYDHEGEFEIDQDRADRANVIIEYAKDILAEAGDAPRQVWIEAFVDQKGKLPTKVEGWGGPVDLAIRVGDVLHVIDYKDGHKPRYPDSWQNVTYAGGILDQLDRDLIGINTVVTTVVQPKVHDEPRSIVHTRAAFEARYAELNQRMVESMDPDAELKAGDECRPYCPGAKLGRCPAFEASVGFLFANVPAPARASLQPGKQLADYTDLELEDLLDASLLISGVVTDIQEEGFNRAAKGVQFNAWGIGTGRTQRRWAPDAEEKLASKRIKRTAYTATVLLSPAQLEKNAEFKQLKDSAKDFLRSLIVKPEGAPTLVQKKTGKADRIEKAFADVPEPKQEN